MVGRKSFQNHTDEHKRLNQELKALKDTIIKEKEVLDDQHKYVDE